jgi:GNAT superfamily N-acetyltransferase
MEQDRRNGTGHLLLDEAKRWAKSPNQQYPELMVWENNGMGRRFYEREHFITASRTMRMDVYPVFKWNFKDE